MSRLENETAITFNEEEPHAVVWSASPLFQRHMQRTGVEPYKIDARVDSQSCWYRVPKEWVRVRPPRKVQLTDEQRAEMGERLRQNIRRQSENAHFPPDSPTRTRDSAPISDFVASRVSFED